MKPMIGRIVHYKLSGEDVEDIIARRRWCKDAFGSEIHPGDVVAALVSGVNYGSSVNLRLFMDGSDFYWVTSRHEGTCPGQWRWPEMMSVSETEQLAALTM